MNFFYILRQSILQESTTWMDEWDSAQTNNNAEEEEEKKNSIFR